MAETLLGQPGFAAAQMIVHAVQAGGDDVDAMVKALEGYAFDSVKGRLTIRAADHALLQPMFEAKLCLIAPGPRVLETKMPHNAGWDREANVDVAVR